MNISFVKGDTIAAIATPPGEGAIAIIRISGDNALAIAGTVFSGKASTFQSHRAYYGKIVDDVGNTVDQVLLLFMQGPKSYTGEDTVEIFCHGGSIIAKKVLQTVLKAGARAAMPGEFSLKAFRNGKIDLAQAEAVQELISAKNELAAKAAENQLEGALSHLIQSFQKKLTNIAAILEAWVDFPEEDLEFSPFEEVIADLEMILQEMQKLEDTFEEGKILTAGLSLCLAGSPNVGKSSLMNALLGKERAIVTDIAGTTRDLLEEDLMIAGLHFRLMDTAGIRDTEELVEKEGIKRSRNALKNADLVLLILDASRKLSAEDKNLLNDVPQEKTIVVWNKIDLGHSNEKITADHVAAVSAKERIGLDALKKMISEIVWKKGPPSKEEIFITKARHKEALIKAIQALKKVILGLKNKVSPEFASADMRDALGELGTIVGTHITEDILSAIFAKFCVGK